MDAHLYLAALLFGAVALVAVVWCLAKAFQLLAGLCLLGKKFLVG